MCAARGFSRIGSTVWRTVRTAERKSLLMGSFRFDHGLIFLSGKPLSVTGLLPSPPSPLPFLFISTFFPLSLLAGRPLRWSGSIPQHRFRLVYAIAPVSFLPLPPTPFSISILYFPCPILQLLSSPVFISNRLSLSDDLSPTSPTKLDAHPRALRLVFCSVRESAIRAWNNSQSRLPQRRHSPCPSTFLHLQIE